MKKLLSIFSKKPKTELSTVESTYLPEKYFTSGALSEVKSFGELTLGENYNRVSTALTKMEPMHRNFGKSQSDFQTKALRIGMSSTPEKALRELSAEIQKKKQALEEAQHNVMLKQVDIQENEDKALKTDDVYEKQRLIITASKLRCEMNVILTNVEGAMKLVLSLEKMYDSYMIKCEGFTEEDFEKAEIKSHLKRSLRQSLEDMRETSGHIGKGEQVYLTGMGLNITRVQNKLREYLRLEATSDNYSNVQMDEYLDQFADFLIPSVEESMKHRSLDIEYDKSIGFTPEYNKEANNG